MSEFGLPDVQGVRSEIQFPLGQDEMAVGRAINCLLNEGWKFRSLSKTHIIISRMWEVPMNPDLQGCHAVEGM